MALLCNGCDHERETIRAYCPSCEEVTESYEFSGDEPKMLNLARRIDEIAERRAATVTVRRAA